MARGPRRDAPDEIHHVWARGLDRQRIFHDERDRHDLLDRWSTVLPESGLTCLAWSLLPNHYHLVLKRGPVSISRAMARIHSGYATRFNRRHERVGFLFQNRFGSRIVDSDADLIAAIRYVTRNPLKHGVCADDRELAGYPWSSASGLAGNRDTWPFEALGETRSILDGRIESPNEGIPGAADVQPRADRDRLVPWIDWVCGELGVTARALTSRERSGGISEARAAISWIAVTQLGLPGAHVAERLGLSRSGVSRALVRGRSVCRELGLATATQQLNQRPR
jgi:REP element-mobilizing transposase RayT